MLKFPKGYGLGYGQKILKGTEGFKSPMLVVGANSFIRKHVNADTLSRWDVHVLFFPQPAQYWHVGLLYLSREEGVYAACLDTETDRNARTAMVNILKEPCEAFEDTIELREKAHTWLAIGIYRCPKISLKDILALEPYDVKKTA